MFELLPFDRTLTDAVEIVFKIDDNDPVQGLPLGETPLPLQFPPRITSETKSADWNEIYKGSWEPQAIWKGASARKITLELTYIVDGAQFGTQEIATITKQVKGYFYRAIPEDSNSIPRMTLKMYNHVGEELPGDFRLHEVNITHGESIIQDGDGVFPLLTKIIMTASLTTQIGGIVDINTLQTSPISPDWY